MRTLSSALVVGSTGFWGSWLVDRLVRAGVRVTGVGRTSRPLPAGLAAPDELLQIDITQTDPGEYSEGFDAIFFLAGRASVPASVVDPVADLDENVRAAVGLLHHLKASRDPASFLYASSAAVYGSATTLPMPESHSLGPLSPYGVSKLAAEEYVRLYATAFGVPGASVRPFSLYGPGQDKQVVYDLSVKIAKGESPLRMLGRPDVSRDFIHVADAAAGLIAIARSAPLRGEVYNLASGTETTLGKLVALLLSVAERDTSVEFSGHVREGDPVRWCGDASAVSSLGFELEVSLDEGLRSTFAWVQETLATTIERWERDGHEG